MITTNQRITVMLMTSLAALFSTDIPYLGWACAFMTALWIIHNAIELQIELATGEPE